MNTMTFDCEPTPGLVSIIMPTRRAERFIGAALDSIAQQTYADWEVIVVEDGSQGPTRAIVDDFARRHSSHRVEYLRNERNCGAAHSRNVAFAASRGEFVAPLDADDQWFPQHLARCVAELQSSGAAVAYGSSVMIEDATEMLLGVWGPEPRDLGEFPQSLLRRNFVNPSATVMRRRLLGAVGPWDTTLRYCEDLGYWLRCVAAGEQFRYVGGLHCLYRKNHAGATTQRTCATQEEFAEIVQRGLRFPEFAGKKGRRAVAKAFRRAAELHATCDPQQDSSADRSRAAALLFKAWRLQPRHMNYLAKAARLAVGKLLASRRSTPESQSVVAPADRIAA